MLNHLMTSIDTEDGSMPHVDAIAFIDSSSDYIKGEGATPAHFTVDDPTFDTSCILVSI